MNALAPWAWTPNPCRVIRLWQTAACAPTGRVPAALPLRWPDKAAAEVVDCTIDASAIQASPSDILSLTIAGTGDLALIASLVSGASVTLWLGGGTIGEDAAIDLTLATAGGRQVRRIIRMRITP